MAYVQCSDEASVTELQDLLNELQEVGGSLRTGDDATQRTYHGSRRGTLGSTDVLAEQQQSGNNNIGFHHRRSFNGASSPTKLQSRFDGTSPSAAAAGATTFSTYNNSAAASGDVAQAIHTQHTPLNVRLAPLSAAAVATPAATVVGAAAAATNKLSPSPSAGKAYSTFKHNPVAALPPLSPSAAAEPAGAAAALPPPLDGAAVGHTTEEQQVQQQQQQQQLAVEREANFLPIMCARYLKPEGLCPRARWGHTLTPITPTTLYTFGGMETGGEESNLLSVFHTDTIAWEPVGVEGGRPPRPRHSHAACGHEDRYLFIHGGTASSGGSGEAAPTIFGDLHMFDVQAHTWTCLWPGQAGASENKNIPSARFAHTMVVRDDKLYLYGGRSLKTGLTTTMSNNKGLETALVNGDVYIFSLNSRRWKKRLRGGKVRTVPASEAPTPSTTPQKAQGQPEKDDKEKEQTATTTTTTTTAVPPHRAYHAASVQGNKLYINGGNGSQQTVLSDTWELDLVTGAWRVVHPGGSADAIPREQHELFVCGEALLLVGGCTASMFSDKIAGKFFNFVSVLPLVGQQMACWIPVAMGNVSVVQPSKRSFAAAFSGGFVHVFGGMSGAEPATNSMVRFLAADGYVSADARATDTANEAALRAMMQHAREKSCVPVDVYAVVGSWGGGSGGGGSSGNGEDAERGNRVGFHKALLAKRAPLFLQALEACRSEPLLLRGGNASNNNSKGLATAPTGAAAADGDLLDNFVRSVGQGGSAHQPPPQGSTTTTGSGTNKSGATLYYTTGNTRVQGLTAALTVEELQYLADYIYWGGLSSSFRTLMETEDEGGEDEEKEKAGAAVAVVDPVFASERVRLTAALQALHTAATTFQLGPLEQLCDSLLKQNKKKLHHARRASAQQLQADLCALLESGAGATVTVLCVDPHTRQQSAHALHPLVLTAASPFFADLLGPLFRGEREQFQVGPVAAKVTPTGGGGGGNGLTGATSKRAVLVGPISVPRLAVQPILRFLYTMQLRAPTPVALDVMMGAHVLGLSALQAYSEALVARGEVNYDSCCSFLYLATRYQASLLEEMALLTAVSGFAEVQHSLSYRQLPPAEQHKVEAVAKELGSASWVPPPQPTNEMKSPEEYKKRWQSSAAF